jgi:serine/threonine protein phosphatase PrpC
MTGRTTDHSFVQRLVEEGKITEEPGQHAPAVQPAHRLPGHPPGSAAFSAWHIDAVLPGDTLLACSDGLWHYFAPKELGAIVHALPPREASEMLVTKARQRARGGGDNLSLAMVRIDPLKA